MFATLFSVLVLGALLEWIYNHEMLHQHYSVFKRICYLICLVLCLEVINFASNYISDGKRSYIYNTNELDIGEQTTAEYLRYETELSNLPYKVVGQKVIIKDVVRDGLSLTLRCKTEEDGGTVSVPILNYKGYCVRDEFGTEYCIFDGINNEISFELPAYYEGVISVTFEPFWYWRIAWWISVLYILLLTLMVSINRLRNSKNR